jgi:hypothetical protein
MKNYSLKTVVNAADAVIPEQNERHANHALMRNHRDMLLVGIGWEMAVIKPSYPELASAIGCSHNCCIKWLHAWREIDWRERYGWLRLVEGRLAHETNPVDASVL